MPAPARNRLLTSFSPRTRPISVGELTFTRASARTHPDTGAEIASGVPLTRTLTEVVPADVQTIASTANWAYVGKLPSGLHVYLKVAANELYTTPDGKAPFTLWQSFSGSVLTPRGSVLTSNGAEPAVISRRPWNNLASLSTVLTMDRGFPVWDAATGTSIIYAGNEYSGGGMDYATDGVDTIWLSEYSNTTAIKNSVTPPRTLWKSTDDGATWTLTYQWGGISGTHVHSLFYDSPTGNLYAALGDGAQANTGIWKSTDGGTTWSQVMGSTYQPVACIRFNGYLWWGSDTIPTHVLRHDTAADTFVEFPVDYDDNSIPITWNGVTYGMYVIGAYLIINCSQGQEAYHRTYASTDGMTWHKILDTTNAALGFTSRIAAAAGALIVRPTETTSDHIYVPALQTATRTVFHTDEAYTPMVAATTPLASGWTIVTGEYVEGGGPGGMRAVKNGGTGIRVQNIPVVAGDVIEISWWIKNMTGGNSVSHLCYAEFNAQTNAGGTVEVYQRGALASLFRNNLGWDRWVVQRVMPATTEKVGLRIFGSGFTYNSAGPYFLVAGISASKNGVLMDIESHVRAAESAYQDRSVGSTWGVYDRIYPSWDTVILATNKTVLRLTDLDTSVTLEVVYNGTTKAFDFVHSAGGTVSSGAQRCMGMGNHHFIRNGASTVRRHYGPQDWLAFGVHRTASVTELVVWDRVTRAITKHTAAAAFTPTRLRVEFPSSGVAHAPVWSRADVPDARLVPILMTGRE